MLCVSLSQKKISYYPLPSEISNDDNLQLWLVGLGGGAGGGGGEGGLLPNCLWRILQIMKYEKWCPLCEFEFEINHHSGDYVPCSLRAVCKFFNVPQNLWLQGFWGRAYGLSSLSDKVKLGNTVMCLCPVMRNVFHIYWKQGLQSYPFNHSL